MKNVSANIRYLTELALLVAIILVMKLTGLASIPVGPLYMTFTMVPIAIGAIIMGPLAGGVLGMIYGFTSYYDAATGAPTTGLFFQLNPLSTFVLCVVIRTLVGVLTGWLFRALRKVDSTKTICYFVCSLAAPVLNTILFMGYIAFFFYEAFLSTDKVQDIVSTIGMSSPLLIMIFYVGLQGLVEAAIGTVVGGTVSKTVSHALKRD